MRFSFSWIVGIAMVLPSLLSAAENTKVLPKGRFNFNTLYVFSQVSQQASASGEFKGLGSPLEQNLQFDDLYTSLRPVEKTQFKAFMNLNGFEGEQVLGQFLADVKSRVQAIVPVLSYGISNHISLAVGVPIYRAQTKISLGFLATDLPQRFALALAKPENNQRLAARRIAAKLSKAPDELNRRLMRNGYSPLQDWQGEGVGDLRLGLKYKIPGDSNFRSTSITAGVTAPTGKTDDPDQLIDVPFGDGQWDVFSTLAVDWNFLGEAIVLNQFLTYTYQSEGTQIKRLVTDEESIAVEKQRLRFKKGDIFEAGSSATFLLADFGLKGMIGYRFYEKGRDQFFDINQKVSRKLEKDTYQQAHHMEYAVGLSTLSLFQKKKFSVPFEAMAKYTRVVKGRNLPISHQTSVELSMFF